MLTPNRPQPLEETRRSHRAAENINQEYRQKVEVIENFIKEHRDNKQEIFTPDQLIQILDAKVINQP